VWRIGAPLRIVRQGAAGARIKVAGIACGAVSDWAIPHGNGINQLVGSAVERLAAEPGVR
jgi:hypothetical protein